MCKLFSDAPAPGQDVCEHAALSGESGALSSPNYPSNYGNSLDCETVITGTEGYTVLVTIADMEIETANNGCWDNLVVRFIHCTEYLYFFILY